MSQLGERLQEAREGQGISLSQASVETRILQRYLVALEDGDYQHLPGDVYARGFIRNYANYLGLPAEELIDLYRRDRGISEPIRVVPATSSPRIRGLVVPSFFGVFFVVLVLIGGSYLLLSALNLVGDSSQAQVAIQPTIAPTPRPLPTPAPEPTGAPALAAVPTTPPTFGPVGAALRPKTAPTQQLDAPIGRSGQHRSGRCDRLVARDQDRWPERVSQGARPRPDGPVPGPARFLRARRERGRGLGGHQRAEAVLRGKPRRGDDVYLAASVALATGRRRAGGRAPFFCVILSRSFPTDSVQFAAEEAYGRREHV